MGGFRFGVKDSQNWIVVFIKGFKKKWAPECRYTKLEFNFLSVKIKTFLDDWSALCKRLYKSVPLTFYVILRETKILSYHSILVLHIVFIRFGNTKINWVFSIVTFCVCLWNQKDILTDERGERLAININAQPRRGAHSFTLEMLWERAGWGSLSKPCWQDADTEHLRRPVPSDAHQDQRAEQGGGIRQCPASARWEWTSVALEKTPVTECKRR